YIQFSVKANCGLTLNLTSLTFDAARGGDSGLPRGWALLSDLDGFCGSIDQQDVPTTRPVLTNFTVDLSGSQYQGLSEITLRLYIYVTGDGRSLEFDNITINGTVQ